MLSNKLCLHFRNQNLPSVVRITAHKPSSVTYSTKPNGEEQKNISSGDDFPPLRLFAFARKPMVKRKVKSFESIAARSATMKPDQEWSNVWPVARSFQPATVPLPVRMGTPPYKTSPTVDKWNNAELMKIPNFLHLTPPAVEKHCAAIRKYCSPWPDGVSYASMITMDTQNPNPNPVKKSKVKLPTHEPDPDAVFTDPGYFPMTVTKTSYLYSGPSIRDERARVVTLKIRLEDLQLNDHSYDKLLRLVGDRYDRETHTISIIGDRCPLYSQNLDYCHYLLTVILAEAQTKEPWEHEKQRQDQQAFVYSGSRSEAALAALRDRQRDCGAQVVSEPLERRYEAALTQLLNEEVFSEALASLSTTGEITVEVKPSGKTINERRVKNTGETDISVSAYSESVLAMLGITERMHDAVSTHNPTIGKTPDLPDLSVKSYYERINVVWQECGWYPRIPR